MRDWNEFQTEVPGKWVLAGEHAVLRGATAVALPHAEFKLKLSFQPDRSVDGLRIEPDLARGVAQELIEAAIENRRDEEFTITSPRGRLTLESSIPVGAGLGSSAALCVALTRWMAGPLQIQESDQLEFARQLEHRFHGRSSGMDVAVAAQGIPISFSQDHGASVLGIRKLPRFTFHDTGLRSRTSECVLKVERLQEEQPVLAMRIDEGMALASRKCVEGLALYDRGQTAQGLVLLTEGMRRAQECFLAWELVPGQALRIIQELKSQGALEAKLTGAGGGGFVVALWE